MRATLEQVSCASLPLSALAVLADLRRESDIRVAVIDQRAWIRWDPGDARVLDRVLPVAGALLYLRRDGHWYRPGRHLPELHLPAAIDGESTTLARAILPGRIDVREPGDPSIRPARLRLVRDDRLRPPAALRCTLEALARWAEDVPGSRLASLLGTTDGADALVLGRRLPSIADAVRFWGTGVLTPLGFRAEPDVPEGTLRRALGVGEDEVLVLAASGHESIPRDALRPLDRAGIRLARGDRNP